MRALLLSTYDVGRQPFGLASPAAWLSAAGWDVTCVDLAKERLNDERIGQAALVAIHLPMHTATRLAAPVIAHVQRVNPAARICAYGLYAPLNAEWLRGLGVDAVFGGEFEAALTEYAVGEGLADPKIRATSGPASAALPRLQFRVPDRSGLPPLSRYATLQMPDGTRKLVGYTEASRGCKHLCRHCPIVPVYNGQFRVVQPDVVLADVTAQIGAGAAHVTFGDPDFLNGPTHALRVAGALHNAFPDVTYDATIKIEHLLKHRTLLPRLRDTGCLFVTSAVESLDDAVLAHLDKGHTRQDFVDAVAACRAAGLTLVPTFVAFHPWLTLDDYCDLLETIAALDLVEHVAPIQLAIRLLIPSGSRLLELDDVQQLVAGFDPATLAYSWAHRDPRVDDLHRVVEELVGVQLTGSRPELFTQIAALAYERAGKSGPAARAAGGRPAVPYLNEPWYCCAEPTKDQLRLV